MPIYLNNVTIGGYLVKDPDGSPTKEGHQRVKFIVAVNNPAKRKPDYIRCVAWGERAGQITRYTRKGQGIIVVGELTTTTWPDKNGMNHTTTEIVVEKFNLVGDKPAGVKPGVASIKKPTPPISSE
jgi:single-strand DNA-binding protein